MAMTPEGKVKKKVVEQLKQLGCYYFFPATGGYGKSGVPDIERSQLQNKTRALELLRTKIALKEKEDQMKELNSIRGDQVEAGWGRQIRSYVMQPYQQVKDSRTNTEVGNIQAVLDGEINIFIKDYLKWRRRGLND